MWRKGLRKATKGRRAAKAEPVRPQGLPASRRSALPKGVALPKDPALPNAPGLPKGVALPKGPTLPNNAGLTKI